jgi:hypothetical protein
VVLTLDRVRRFEQEAGGADFESQSRTNQLACGLSVAYLAALWVQRQESVPAAPPSV